VQKDIKMKIVKENQAQTYTSAESLSLSVEYPLSDRDIDCALVKISGLYPAGGWAVNTKSKELMFCIDGGGVFEMKAGGKYKFEKNDVILIESGEVYRLDAQASFCVVCTPPWTPEQHKNILD
jgi:mannose-6-phosphate isomerase-like protein (cupin superfamily)